MAALGNDRYAAAFPLERVGRYIFTVEAWHDVFASLLEDIAKKRAAGAAVGLEIDEAIPLLAAAAARKPDGPIALLCAALQSAETEERLRLIMKPETAGSTRRRGATFSGAPRAGAPLDAERTVAGFASWYESSPFADGDPAAMAPSPTSWRACRRSARWDSTFSICRRSIRSAHPSQGPQQRAYVRARRSGKPLCDRLEPRAAMTNPSGSSERLPTSAGSVTPRAGGASRSRSISRSSVARSPLGARSIRSGSSGVAGRLDQICREPAQEIRRHRQRRFLRARSRRRICGARCATSCFSGAGRACASSGSTTRTPSRSPFWDWMIERRRASRSRRDLPR